MRKGHALDSIDRKILRELQRDGRISNVELAARIGLSAPPTLRRVQVLEREGFIAGYRAQLNAQRLGFGIQMFAFVGLKSQSEAELKAFETRVAAWPLVREAYAASGDDDFILHLVGSDLAELQNFVITTLTAAPNVDNVKTTHDHACFKVRAWGAAYMTESAAAAPTNWITLTASALTAVIVGFASTILVVMQALAAIGATPGQQASGAAALCIGMAISSFILSWRHHMPIITAWSTPGAVLIATGAGGISYAEALGAFIVAGAFMMLTALIGPLARAIASIPALR